MIPTGSSENRNMLPTSSLCGFVVVHTLLKSVKALVEATVPVKAFKGRLYVYGNDVV
jgi:hypothetical protein